MSVAIVVTLAAALLTSCGGDDEGSRRSTEAPTSTVLDGDEWRQRAQQGCARWNEDYAHLATADPSTAEEAVQHSREVEELASGLARELRELGPSGDDPREVEQLVELSQDMASAAGELVDAAEGGDGPAVERATRRIGALGDRINAIADRIEVPACGGY